ncbi:MAG: PIN domain-containing protein [Actinomycetota bacterium]|nr:PIN domain-containing protein [Actinomycetota bacterium]
MRVVADSHAIVWYGHDSPRLSDRARETLDDAVASDGVVMSIVTLVELWYVTQTTGGVSQEELDAISEQVSSSLTMGFAPVDEAVAGKFTTIDRDLLRDPWDRFIVATALAFALPLVTADRRIQKSGLVEAIW